MLCRPKVVLIKGKEYRATFHANNISSIVSNCLSKERKWQAMFSHIIPLSILTWDTQHNDANDADNEIYTVISIVKHHLHHLHSFA